MKCKDCTVPPMYDYQENCKLCGLFGWDNFDEHFKVYADGEDGCIHRKATIEKLYNEECEGRLRKELNICLKKNQKSIE
jgi:hypothetical protein